VLPDRALCLPQAHDARSGRGGDATAPSAFGAKLRAVLAVAALVRLPDDFSGRIPVFAGRESLLREQPNRPQLLQEILVQIFALQGRFGQTDDRGHGRSIPVLVSVHVTHSVKCSQVWPSVAMGRTAHSLTESPERAPRGTGPEARPAHRPERRAEGLGDCRLTGVVDRELRRPGTHERALGRVDVIEHDRTLDLVILACGESGRGEHLLDLPSLREREHATLLHALQRGLGPITPGYPQCVEPLNQSVGEITRDLEAFKLALIEMTPSDLDRIDAEGIAREISAIRLQLKRLEADRTAMQ
jgi:hypothetical protein